MAIISDLRVLYNLAFKKVRGDTHQERLESFYGKQAGDYDAFRKRLLHGREEMVASLDLPEGGRMLDMGGGTGANIEFIPEDRRAKMSQITVVDLCPSLLETAKGRIAAKGWTNVDTALADVTTFDPPGGPLDVITFSYSLTMIPDWFRAMQRAYDLLKPGGLIGVVDFYVARKWPAEGMKKHGWFRRTFWPTWFANDNVYLSPDHLPWLRSRFETVKLEERLGKVPYMLWMKAPHYIFVGKKPG